MPLFFAGLAGAGIWLKRRHREEREAEQKAHDRALHMEQARLASVMEGTTDAVAFAAPDLTLRYLNPAGLRMFGIDEKADLSQLKLREFYPMAAAEFMRSTAFPKAIAEGTWSGEILMVRRDGKELPVSQVLLAHYVGGEIQFYSTIIRNLSERKASEEALAAALKHARLLSELGRSLTEATTAPEAAQLVMEAADELMHWDCAWVRLWREEKYRFERVYGYDTVDGQRKEFESTTGALDVGSPLVREVVVGGPKLILRRTEEESVPGLRPFGGDRRSLSLMFVPMRHAGKVVGVISVQSYRADAFNSTHLGLLQSLADHCAGNIERIDAERALRVSENRWRMAMAVAKFGTWDWDFTTQEVVASSELPAMFGGPGIPTLTVEKDFRQFIHPEDRAQVDAAITTAIQLRGAFHSEFRVLWLDGTVRWIEGRGEVFCLATGEPDRMVGVSTDITERKLAEQELRQSRILLDRVGRVAGVGGWHLNLETQRVWWSDETCRIHGLPPGHVPSLDDAIKFYTPEAQPVIRAAVEQGIREGKPWDLELPFRTADGRDLIVRAMGEAEFSGGKAVGLIGGFQDITERKKLETREAQRLVRLREQSRLIQEIATSREVVEGNVARAAALIAEKLAQFLGVERVSVWLLDATGQSLDCVDLFERTPARHTQAARLEAGQFPRYFAALASGRILDAVDAATDPRTAEFAEVYLRPTNIHSMLDASLRVEGHLVGVLCIESVGQRREWDPDETACAAAVADQLALAIAHRDRRAVEDRFRNLVECMAEGLLMTDFEDTIQFANRRVTEMLGFNTAELVGRKGYEVFMVPGQREGTLKRNERRRNGAFEVYELPLRHKDGRTVWVEVSAGPFRDGAGNVIGTLGAITDITQRRASQTQLELLSQTLKSTRDCVAVAELEDRLLFVNDAFLTTYGYTREEIVGGPTARLRAAVQPTGPVPDIRGATLRDGGWHGELMNARKDGAEFPVELWTSVVRDDTGKPVATVGVARDITERRKLEAQFRQSQKMEGIGQLAGGVAHDFNNLLTVIQGHVSLLLEQVELTSLARESVTEIGGSATRAAELTRQLLTFSRRQPLRMAAHDLNHVVPGVSRLFQWLVGEHIVVDIRPALQPVNVRADSGMIEQALLNLVVNARDAMPAGGRIIIETGVVEIAERDAVAPARPGHFAMLTVSDSGHGIPPEVLPHIFEPFFTTKDVGQGTGLGLPPSSASCSSIRAGLPSRARLGKGPSSGCSSRCTCRMPRARAQARLRRPRRAAAGRRSSW